MSVQLRMYYIVLGVLRRDIQCTLYISLLCSYQNILKCYFFQMGLLEQNLSTRFSRDMRSCFTFRLFCLSPQITGNRFVDLSTRSISNYILWLIFYEYISTVCLKMHTGMSSYWNFQLLNFRLKFSPPQSFGISENFFLGIRKYNNWFTLILIISRSPEDSTHWISKFTRGIKRCSLNTLQLLLNCIDFKILIFLS